MALDGEEPHILSPAQDKDTNMGRKAIDVSGQKFGRLTVLRRTFAINGQARWDCLCDCGNGINVAGTNLKHGNTRSCGCLLTNVLEKRNIIHGLARTSEYETWCRAKISAEKRGLQFDLEPSDIIYPEFCPVLGIRIEQNTKRGPNDSSPSLDRIFPERGYVKGNIRVISQKANRIKNDATAEELEKVLDDSRRFEIFAYA